MAGTHTLTMPGQMLERGFWLYVGRTGDSYSHKAAPPYARMGQHLGHIKASNALRAHLEWRGIEPERCHEYDLIAHGPLFSEQQDVDSHRGPRDIVAGLEKRLADALRVSGYDVLNTVNCRKLGDETLWKSVMQSFVEYFPKIGKYEV